MKTMLVFFVFTSVISLAEVPVYDGVNQAIKLISELEGFSPNRFWDVKRYSIGYGTEALPGEKTITKKEAKRRLVQRVLEIDTLLNKEVKITLSDNQRAVLISFVYNLGEGAFRKSTLLKVINNNQLHKVPSELRKWVYADGKKNSGLINRREREVKHWMK